MPAPHAVGAAATTKVASRAFSIYCHHWLELTLLSLLAWGPLISLPVTFWFIRSHCAPYRHFWSRNAHTPRLCADAQRNELIFWGASAVALAAWPAFTMLHELRTVGAVVGRYRGSKPRPLLEQDIRRWKAGGVEVLRTVGVLILTAFVAVAAASFWVIAGSYCILHVWHMGQPLGYLGVSRKGCLMPELYPRDFQKTVCPIVEGVTALVALILSWSLIATTQMVMAITHLEGIGILDALRRSWAISAGCRKVAFGTALAQGLALGIWWVIGIFAATTLLWKASVALIVSIHVLTTMACVHAYYRVVWVTFYLSCRMDELDRCTCGAIGEPSSSSLLCSHVDEVKEIAKPLPLVRPAREKV